MYRIVHLNGENKGRRQKLQRRSILAGSDLGCLLWIDDEHVAPRQAEWVVDSEGLRVHSLVGVSEGLQVNGVPVSDARLSHGDRVDMGARAFRVEERTALHRFRSVVLVLFIFLLARIAWNARPTAEPRPARPLPVGVPGPRPGEVRSPPLSRPEADPGARGREEALSPFFDAGRARPEEGLPPTAAAETEAERRRRADRVLEQARAAVSQGQREEAHRRLGHLQEAFPEYVSAHAERARLYEAQESGAEAKRHWLRVLRYGAASPLFGEAADAVNRLSMSELPVRPWEREISTQRDPAGGRSRLYLARMEPVRFPQTDEFDEMRIVRFTVAAEGGGRLGSAALEVVFYDRCLSSGVLQSTGAGVFPESPIALPEGDWPVDGIAVSVSYTVPVGQRERERRRSGRTMEYAGFRARLYAGEILQEEAARPPSLLSLTDALP